MSENQTATTPNLREQVANALAGSNLREVGGDGTLVRPFAAKSPMAFAYADAALSVVAPVLEGLRAELENANRANGELAAQVLEVLGENARLRSERDALSSLLRGMARRVGEVRDEMRFATKHVDAWRKRADRLRSQRDKAREHERAEAAVPAVHAEWDADGDFRSADCLAKGCPLCVSSDWAKRQVPSSVQGDTTPEEA